MVYAQFIVGFITYLGLASASYSKAFQSSRWFFPVGALAAMMANVLWLSIAKSEPSASELVIKGLYWDVMLTATYMLVPIMFFGAEITLRQYAGIGLIIIGIILVKI